MAEPARVMGHLGLNYRPGEGAAAAALFALLGCEVQDNGSVGPGGSLYTIVIDRPTTREVDNILYLSPMQPAQQAFEARLAQLLDPASGEPDPAFAAWRDMKAHEPEMFFHAAFRYETLEALESAVLAIEDAERSDSRLTGRVSVTRFRPRSDADAAVNDRIARSPIFRPDDRRSFGDFGVQVFLHTDLFGGELVSLGQTIELDYLFPRHFEERSEPHLTVA